MSKRQSRTFHFTARGLDALKPPEHGQTDYWDGASNIGFGIRVSQGGSKTFFQMYRRNKKRKRNTIGRYPNVSLARMTSTRQDAM